MIDKVTILDKPGQYKIGGRIKFYATKKEAAISLDEKEVKGVDFSANEEIKLIVYGSYYEYYSAVVDVFDRDFKVLKVKNICTNGEGKGPEDLKVDMECKLSIMFKNENNDTMSLEVRLRDLSASGFCFVSQKDLAQDIRYELIFSILKEPIIINFDILRKVYRYEEKEYVYGCKFVNLDEKEEEMLRQQVYHTNYVALKKLNYKNKLKQEV